MLTTPYDILSERIKHLIEQQEYTISEHIRHAIAAKFADKTLSELQQAVQEILHTRRKMVI